MIKRIKEKILKIIAIIFLMLGIAALIDTLINRHPSQVLWFCYIGLIFLGVGIFLKKDQIITSQLNILTIPLMVWSIDFFYQLILNKKLFGITDYFFTPPIISISSLISLQHIFTLPLAFFALYLIKTKTKRAYLISIAQIILLAALSLISTNKETNVNCILDPCFSIPNLPGPYIVYWFIATIIMILITNYTLSELKFLKK